ncbi:head GIN domain-containing protein [Desulfobacula toluolica]|uniref:Conserved uncharacterized protein n=1 Tax=Desulfobacula toluolica (strain DSM 7467 / Tol2) TaxID=651182 RepID=K0NM21_DESTT|nr:head GIN domain-containing protein [Desulfobacula toluolica]CCK81058.1 conserved uncharacterized protein [Desulfobacula toluolica Tol2]
MKQHTIFTIYAFSVTLLTVWCSVFVIPNCAFAMNIVINKDFVEMNRSDGKISSGTTTNCIVGNGLLKKEKRDLSFFNEININGTFDVNIGLQKKQSVEILCDENLLSQISTRVSDGGLHINTIKSVCPKSGLTINIFLPNLESLNCSGANSIVVENMNNDHFFLKLDGANDVRISGKTHQFNIEILGVGDLHANRLQAETVTIESQGSSDAYVYASKRLQVTLMGAGDIYYYGEPVQIDSRIEGVGDLINGE